MLVGRYGVYINQLFELVFYLIRTGHVVRVDIDNRPETVRAGADMQRLDIAAAPGENLRNAHQYPWYIACLERKGKVDMFHG
jgi:hypothetical protein